MCSWRGAVFPEAVLKIQARRRSQLLQPAVHVPLAALAGPRPTLQPTLAQVLLEGLVEHRPVGLRHALRLRTKTRAGQCVWTGGGIEVLSQLWTR